METTSGGHVKPSLVVGTPQEWRDPRFRGVRADERVNTDVGIHLCYTGMSHEMSK